MHSGSSTLLYSATLGSCLGCADADADWTSEQLLLLSSLVDQSNYHPGFGSHLGFFYHRLSQTRSPREPKFLFNVRTSGVFLGLRCSRAERAFAAVASREVSGLRVPTWVFSDSCRRLQCGIVNMFLLFLIRLFPLYNDGLDSAINRHCSA